IRELKLNGKIYKQEYEFILMDGSTVWVEYYSKIYPEKGWIVSAMVDISERKSLDNDLKEAHSVLEKKVEKRTVTLKIANGQLQQEINVRTQAEKELLQSKEKFYSLVTNIPGVVYRCASDKHWTMEFISDEIEKLSGYPASDFIKNAVRSYASIIHPDDSQMVEETVRESVNHNLPYTIEYRVKHRDGSTRWVHERGQAIKDKRGEVTCLDGAIFNITESKQAVEELEKTKDHLHNIFKTSADGILLTDNKGVITMVNEAVEKMLDYSRDELIGKHPRELVPKGKEYEAERKEFVKQLHEEGTVKGKELIFSRKGGRVVNVEQSVAFLKDKQGNVVGSIGSIRDITERKALESNLRESEEFLRKVIDADPNLIFVKDRSGKYIEISNSMAKLFGVTVDAVVGKTDLELAEIAKMSMREAKKYRLDDLQVITTGKQKFIPEESMTQSDGTIKWYQTTKVPLIRNNVSDYVLGVSVDITKRKRANDLLKKRERELEVKNQTLEELNTALKVLLQKKDENRLELEEKVLATMKTLVEPYLEKLTHLCPDARQQNFINIITANLKEIISPFSWKLSTGYLHLTTAEIQVSDLVKNGHSNKEIAEMLNISSETVSVHRKHIRKKLGIKNTKTNLRSYLKTIA
ncbi:MAG: PAS domain S-box protein, partial [Planctomycetota bacterium]